MEYFILSQDKRFLRTPVVENLNKVAWRKDLTIAGCHKILDVNTVFANSEYEQDFIDILDSQLFLVSKIVKEVFMMYETTMRFKMFCVLNNIRNQVGEYYAPIFRDVECASSLSEFNQNKSIIKKLVIQKDKIKNRGVFRLAKLGTDTVIIRMDVAESLFRRNVRGLNLKRVEVD